MTGADEAMADPAVIATLHKPFGLESLESLVRSVVS